MLKLYTIGHSNHPVEKFITLLDDNGIMNLIDVRTAPYSRYNVQFNKENLEYILSQHDIQYIYAGRYLGGRPADPSCYKNNEVPGEGADYLHLVNYTEVMKRPWFIDGVNRMVQIAQEQTTALMCSEEDPSQCHRHHLIAKYLMDEYPEIVVYHIRADQNVYKASTIHGTVDRPSAEQLNLF